MLRLGRVLRAPSCVSARAISARCHSTMQNQPTFDLHNTDEFGIPTSPTWSVNDLLSSYPKPSISPATLRHLHRLSALIPPEEGTLEHAELTAQMEDLVKLVEAVKKADIPANDTAEGSAIPDGRIGAQGVGIQLEDRHPSSEGEAEAHGPTLLRHASRTSGGLYVVEANRAKR